MPASGARATQRIEFGPFRLYPEERLLTRNGDAVHLPPKTFDLLLLLLSTPGHLIQKTEIRERVWPDTYVDDVNMAQHISILRKALGDQVADSEYIETVPRLGYRFVGPVRQSLDQDAGVLASENPASEDVGTTVVVPASRAYHRKITLTLVLALVIVAAFWGRSILQNHARGGEIKSIAVLPIVNLSGDASQDYFAEGMTEALITALSQLDGVQVISPASIMRFKDSRRAANQIGNELKVDAVVEGGVLRSGDHIRFTARLVRTANDRNIWAEKYERSVRDVVVLQDELTSDIAKQIRARVAQLPQEHSDAHTQPSVEAHDAYLKGRYFWNRRTESDYLTAIRWFEEALADDPHYAAAYAGLADTYALLGSMPNAEIARSEAMPRAKAAAEKALELAPSSADAHTSLAFVKMHYEWDFDGAEREFETAIKLNPNYATAHHWYAYDLVAKNRLNEAIAELQRARALDPFSLIINTDLAEAYLWAHRFDDALSQDQGTIALDPSFPLAHMVLEKIYVAKHMFAEGIGEAETAVRLLPGDRWAQTRLAHALASAGRKEEARKILENLERRFVPYGERDDLVLVYAALGYRDRMFAALEGLYAVHDGGLILLNYEESWDPYRSDPRFQDLVHRVGLPAK